MRSQLRLSTAILGALALMVFTTPGCALLDYLKGAPKPKISFQKANLKKLSWSQANIDLNFKLDNPYPVGLGVLGYEWDMKVSGKDFISGKKDKKVTVAAQKSSTIPMPFTLKFSDLINRIKEAKGKGEVPFNVAGKIKVNSPIGPLTIPLKASGDLPVLQKPKVRLSKITAKMQGMTKLIVNIGLGVKQQNGYKLKLADLKYDLKIEGQKVASGKTAPKKGVPNSGETIVDLPITVDLISASSALISSITTGKFRYALATDLGLDTPFGRAPLAFSEDGSLKLY